MAEKKTKTDPDAKIRNRPSPVFDAKHPKVTDNNDHFPLNSESQARNALARASQFSSSPKWWKGSLKELVSAVAGAVHKKYKDIEVSKDGKTPGKKKASSDMPADFVPVLENLIRLRGSDEQDYMAAIDILEDKIELGESHNDWSPIQLERLLESVE